MLRGLIDPAMEGERLEKKKTLLLGVLEKLDKATKAQGYSEKVPKDVQEANKSKAEQTKIELERLKDAMEALKTL